MSLTFNPHTVKFYLYLRFVNLFSYRSAKSLQIIMNESHEKRFSYYFGFQILYGGIVKGLLIIAFSYLLKTLIPTLIVTGCFAFIRRFSGGLHFDSYTKCTYISLGSIIILGILAKNFTLNIWISALVFMFDLIAFVLFAPVEHKNKPIREQNKKKFKIIAIVNLLILTIIYIVIPNDIIRTSMTLGIFMAGLIATPPISKVN